jgi:hypothetical protein
MMKMGNRASGRRSPTDESEGPTEHIQSLSGRTLPTITFNDSWSMTCKRLKVARLVDPETKCQANGTSEARSSKIGRVGNRR